MHPTKFLRIIFRPSNVVCLSVCHSREPCKNGWTDRNGVWVEDSGGPKEPCIGWGSRLPRGKGQFWGRRKGWPVVKYMDTLPWAVQTQLNQSKCCLGFGLGWVHGSMYKVGCTLAPTGEYHWTVRVPWRCSLLSNYYEHLLCSLYQMFAVRVEKRTLASFTKYKPRSAIVACGVSL